MLDDSENLVVISGNPRSGNGVKLESTSLKLRKFIALCFLQSSYDIFNASDVNQSSKCYKFPLNDDLEYWSSKRLIDRESYRLYEISDTNFEVKATDLFKRISVYAIKAKHYKYLSETLTDVLFR